MSYAKKKIISPYIVEKRKELKLNSDHRALESLTISTVNAQKIFSWFVPANCTDRLQPLDLSVNKPANNFYALSLKSGILVKFAVNSMMEVWYNQSTSNWV